LYYNKPYSSDKWNEKNNPVDMPRELKTFTSKKLQLMIADNPEERRPANRSYKPSAK
jgi:hypothetical protein